MILGVIEARPGDGSYIRAGTSDLLSGAFEWGLMLGEQNLDDLVAMRILIETECAGRAADARDADLSSALLRLVNEMRDAVGQPQLFMELDNRFHEMIAAGARNTLYLSLSKTIQRLVGVWYAQTYQLERTKSVTLDEHLAIARAIEFGILATGPEGHERAHPTRWGAIAQDPRQEGHAQPQVRPRAPRDVPEGSATFAR